MSFDRTALVDACHNHGSVARVVVAQVRGSAPREVGAAMLIARDQISGTIGGGTLEHQAIQIARDNLQSGYRKLSRHALGPDLGQCCGGSVDLLTEVYDVKSAEALPKDIILRGEGEMPLAVARIKSAARNAGQLPKAQLLAGWMIEPVSTPDRHLWIWGAGHVGRALVDVICPLPDVKITWVDTQNDRFPSPPPAQVEVVVAADPARLVRFAPVSAEHLIVTYSHELDFRLCHHLLYHGFAYAGLIGSATKWARFRSRLEALGHQRTTIEHITCPIGRPELGKHPHRIALGVVTELLTTQPQATMLEGNA